MRFEGALKRGHLLDIVRFVTSNSAAGASAGVVHKISEAVNPNPQNADASKAGLAHQRRSDQGKQGPHSDVLTSPGDRMTAHLTGNVGDRDLTAVESERSALEKRKHGLEIAKFFGDHITAGLTGSAVDKISEAWNAKKAQIATKATRRSDLDEGGDAFPWTRAKSERGDSTSGSEHHEDMARSVREESEWLPRLDRDSGSLVRGL